MLEILRKVLHAKKYFLAAALAKAAVAGAGLALAFLASIDLAIAVVAKESWDSWQVDALINRFAIVGAAGGVAWQLIKPVIFR